MCVAHVFWSVQSMVTWPCVLGQNVMMAGVCGEDIHAVARPQAEG